MQMQCRVKMPPLAALPIGKRVNPIKVFFEKEQ